MAQFCNLHFYESRHAPTNNVTTSIQSRSWRAVQTRDGNFSYDKQVFASNFTSETRKTSLSQMEEVFDWPDALDWLNGVKIKYLCVFSTQV